MKQVIRETAEAIRDAEGFGEAEGFDEVWLDRFAEAMRKKIQAEEDAKLYSGFMRDMVRVFGRRRDGP